MIGYNRSADGGQWADYVPTKHAGACGLPKHRRPLHTRLRKSAARVTRRRQQQRSMQGKRLLFHRGGLRTIGPYASRTGNVAASASRGNAWAERGQFSKSKRQLPNIATKEPSICWTWPLHQPIGEGQGKTSAYRSKFETRAERLMELFFHKLSRLPK